MPVARRRSISAQSGGAEHVISVPVSFSTQRNAEMSSFDPSRIPAWLAPVCEERSVSHSVRRCVSSASQRAMVGALPSRIARRSTGSASPSISRKTIPGTSVLAMIPCRRAIRCAMRIEYVSSEPRSDGEHDAHGGDDERGEERPAEAVDGEHPVGQGVGQQEDAGVGDQHEQEAEDERERQPQRGEHRRDDRVQRRDDRRDDQRTPEARRC